MKNFQHLNLLMKIILLDFQEHLILQFQKMFKEVDIVQLDLGFEILLPIFFHCVSFSFERFYQKKKKKKKKRLQVGIYLKEGQLISLVIVILISN